VDVQHSKGQGVLLQHAHELRWVLAEELLQGGDDNLNLWQGLCIGQLCSLDDAQTNSSNGR